MTEQKIETIHVRVAMAEKATLVQQAQATGVNVSTLVRSQLAPVLHPQPPAPAVPAPQPQPK